MASVKEDIMMRIPGLGGGGVESEENGRGGGGVREEGLDVE